MKVRYFSSAQNASRAAVKLGVAGLYGPGQTCGPIGRNGVYVYFTAHSEFEPDPYAPDWAEKAVVLARQADGTLAPALVSRAMGDKVLELCMS